MVPNGGQHTAEFLVAVGRCACASTHHPFHFSICHFFSICDFCRLPRRSQRLSNCTEYLRYRGPHYHTETAPIVPERRQKSLHWQSSGSRTQGARAQLPNMASTCDQMAYLKEGRETAMSAVVHVHTVQADGDGFVDFIMQPLWYLSKRAIIFAVQMICSSSVSIRWFLTVSLTCVHRLCCLHCYAHSHRHPNPPPPGPCLFLIRASRTAPLALTRHW